MNVTEEKLNRIKAEYGENAYEQYLKAENAVKGMDLCQSDRNYRIGQVYGNQNSYIMQQHRHIDQIVKDCEPTQEDINKVADEAAKAILG
ncbi:MAG: hypothetical protein KH100_05165 [Dysgonomonas mossii]|uniref:hypothetical protein n=1 Tax=Dysgonomonas mossii TaxID=163665 RepID=UPI001DB79940|nr:hypothetical protein [Dysgonomonas mossii]MBS5797864.1 hypothetical protein [Dysgonomonas mossii]MBS7110575.1 hypothetical protein [Dysgonomonas mossii]